MIEAGSTNPVMLFLFALVLGALHGLEPGHSKTMMAAYIIAVQGTSKQAVLLGVSAAFSHSIIVWVLAMVALTFGNELIGEQLEPWFILISGILVLGIAAWMFWQAVRPQLAQAHDHHHMPAHYHEHHNHHRHDHSHGLDDAHMDAHARAHAEEIRTRLADGRTGTWQTLLFGLSGGLIPCPAAITVFILCLHLGQLALGITLVSAFSIGLAVTLVAIGLVAAIGLKAVSSKTSRFDGLLQAAPWISAALIAGIGLVIIWSGLSHLHVVPHSH
ncbi:MAG: nickel/cobalt efflux transporter [Pseudomonadota bacterium]